MSVLSKKNNKIPSKYKKIKKKLDLLVTESILKRSVL